MRTLLYFIIVLLPSFVVLFFVGGFLQMKYDQWFPKKEPYTIERWGMPPAGEDVNIEREYFSLTDTRSPTEKRIEERAHEIAKRRRVVLDMETTGEEYSIITDELLQYAALQILIEDMAPSPHPNE